MKGVGGREGKRREGLGSRKRDGGRQKKTEAERRKKNDHWTEKDAAGVRKLVSNAQLARSQQWNILE